MNLDLILEAKRPADIFVSERRKKYATMLTIQAGKPQNEKKKRKRLPSYPGV